MLAAVALLVAAWPIASVSLQGSTDKRSLQPAALAASGGWTEVSRPVSPWTPTLEGQARTQVLTFARDGATVTVFIGFYRDQQQGRELVNSMNRLLPESTPAVQIARGRAAVRFGTDEASVRTATIRYDGQRLRIWHWYWLDDRIETSDVRAKLSLAMDRLLVRSDTSAWVAVFTSAETDGQGDAVLSAFARDMGPTLQSALAATAAK
jgi:EpsI family protein